MINFLKRNLSISYCLFIMLFIIDTLSMILQKIAAIHSHGLGLSYYTNLIMQYWVWVSLALAPIHLLIWTKILSRIKLSIAYPVSSLSYPLTMLAAQFILKEHLNLDVWIGAMLITIGVAVVSGKMRTN